MEKLLPCPFCGGEADYVTIFVGEEVTCKKCRAAMPRLSTKKEAITRWNTRYEPEEERTCHIRNNVPSIEGADGLGTCDIVSKCRACGAEVHRDPWDGGYGNYCRICGELLVGMP